MRRKLAILGAILALLALTVGAVAPAASSNDDSESRGPIVRWDLVQFVSGVVLAGGSTVSVDEATGDTLTLTGSGHAEPQQGEAFGGGTFTHERASDTDLSGAYYVTDFISWRRAAGSFEATGLIDGIGNPDDASSGRLKLRVAFVPEVDGEPGPTIKGRLIIDCALPGAPAHLVEGVRVKIGALGLDFVQHEDPDTRGFTLFHVIRER
jgi:hypothetical protein